jgi:hypothetical protein
MNKLPLLLIQALTTGLTLELDHHPAGRHYIHLAYWLAHRIGVTMTNRNEFSQFYNIMAKRDKMEAVLLSIRDDAGSLEDARQWAGDVLDEVGSTSPVMPKDQMPLPAAEHFNGRGVLPGDEESMMRSEE